MKGTLLCLRCLLDWWVFTLPVRKTTPYRKQVKQLTLHPASVSHTGTAARVGGCSGHTEAGVV